MSGHCKDCGEQLDQFGVCPFADVELVKLGRAPVHCGRSADRNAVTIGTEIFHALKEPVVSDQRSEIRLPNFMGIAGDQSRESSR